MMMITKCLNLQSAYQLLCGMKRWLKYLLKEQYRHKSFRLSELQASDLT